PPQAPRSSQEASQPAASEPGPSTPLPAKRSKRTKAEPEAAEPTQTTKGKSKAQGKAAKAKPAPQPGRWLDRDCNAALNMQHIGESKWRPLELCYWPDQGALPAKGKEYPSLGYKRLRDKPPKAQQFLMIMTVAVRIWPAKAKPAPQPGRWLDRDCNAALNMQRIGESRWRPLELCYWPDQGALPAKGKEYPGLGHKRLRDKSPKAQQQQQQQPAEAQYEDSDDVYQERRRRRSLDDADADADKRRQEAIALPLYLLGACGASEMGSVEGSVEVVLDPCVCDTAPLVLLLCHQLLPQVHVCLLLLLQLVLFSHQLLPQVQVCLLLLQLVLLLYHLLLLALNFFPLDVMHLLLQILQALGVSNLLLPLLQVSLQLVQLCLISTSISLGLGLSLSSPALCQSLSPFLGIGTSLHAAVPAAVLALAGGRLSAPPSRRTAALRMAHQQNCVLLHLQACVTVLGENGKIWPVKPVPGPTGLLLTLSSPSATTNAEIRQLQFSTVAFDSRGNHVGAVDSRGSVYSFNLAGNRYVKLDRVGMLATAALYTNIGGQRCLFIGFQDASIRAYDVSKGTVLGILREHRKGGSKPCIPAPCPRSPVQHMAVRACTHELLTTAVDGAVIWDIKKLSRRRALGNGPFGLVQAQFTPDEQCILALFKDGSFFVWHAVTSQLCRHFKLLGSSQLSLLQHTFAISPDSQLLLAAGLHLPFLLLYSLVRLQPLGAAASRARAALQTSGSLVHAILLPTMPCAGGATQLQFLPDSCTAAVLCSNGDVRFINVREGAEVAHVPIALACHKASFMFAMDGLANQLALLADGKLLIYDLAAVRANATRVLPLRVVQPKDVDSVYAEVPIRGPTSDLEEDLSKDQTPQQLRKPLQAAGNGTETVKPANRGQQPAYPLPSAHDPDASNSREDVASRDDRQLRPVTHVTAARTASPSNHAVARVRPGSGVATLAATGGAQPLDRKQLQCLLLQFGEYPAKHRLSIWAFLLQLPGNAQAFQVGHHHRLHPMAWCRHMWPGSQTLVNKGRHAAYANLHKQVPLSSPALLSRLGNALSQLAHWCPVFAEAGFIPGLVFPIVKLHAAGGTCATSPACFEMLATLLINWTPGWFEHFPEPPLGMLTKLTALLTFHDNELVTHLQAMAPAGLPGILWVMLQDLLSSVLAQPDWLRLWDHCITEGPDFLPYFVIAYMIGLRSGLLQRKSPGALADFLGKPPPIDCSRLLQKAYRLRQHTPEALRPAGNSWSPLPPTGNYPEFTSYPAAAVQLYVQERQRIAEAEDDLARRRRVVSELAVRSKAVALHANSMALERQQLTALQQERREQLRQVEAAMAGELQKLEDKAKEEKLKQVAIAEAAQHQALAAMRREWQAELSNLQEDVAARRRLLALQVQSKAEDEAIAQLHFAAQQKMSALDHEVAQQATLTKMRDEAQARAAELEARQRAKLKDWETEDEARRLKAQHEDARRMRQAQAAEDAAAQAAVRKELLVSQLAVEDNILQVDAERRLRALAEEQAALTQQVLETEAQRAAARMAADEQTLVMQAQADASWLAAEQQRREQVLALERDTLQAAGQQAKARVAQTEAQVKLFSDQAALLERRRALEALNAEQELQARRVVEALAVERHRMALLAQELEGKERALAASLSHAQEMAKVQVLVALPGASPNALPVALKELLHGCASPLVLPPLGVNLWRKQTRRSAQAQPLDEVCAALAAAQQADMDTLKQHHQASLASLTTHHAQQQACQPGPGTAGSQPGPPEELQSLQQHVSALEARRQALEAVLGMPTSAFSAMACASDQAPPPSTRVSAAGGVTAAIWPLQRPPTYRAGAAAGLSQGTSSQSQHHSKDHQDRQNDPMEQNYVLDDDDDGDDDEAAQQAARLVRLLASEPRASSCSSPDATRTSRSSSVSSFAASTSASIPTSESLPSSRRQPPVQLRPAAADSEAKGLSTACIPAATPGPNSRSGSGRAAQLAPSASEGPDAASQWQQPHLVLNLPHLGWTDLIGPARPASESSHCGRPQDPRLPSALPGGAAAWVRPDMQLQSGRQPVTPVQGVQTFDPSSRTAQAATHTSTPSTTTSHTASHAGSHADRLDHPPMRQYACQAPSHTSAGSDPSLPPPQPFSASTTPSHATAAAGAGVGCSASPSSLATSGLAPSSSHGYGRMGAAAVTTSVAIRAASGPLPSLQPSGWAARSSLTQFTAVTMASTGQADEVQSRVLGPERQARGLAVALDRGAAHRRSSSSSTPARAMNTQAVGELGEGKCSGVVVAAGPSGSPSEWQGLVGPEAAGHTPSPSNVDTMRALHLQRMQQQDPAVLSASDEVSDVDGLLERLRRDLDLTETESEMSELPSSTGKLLRRMGMNPAVGAEQVLMQQACAHVVIAILLGAGIRACADYRADPKQSAPVWATLEPSLKRCGRSPLKIDAPSPDRALILTHGTYTRHLPSFDEEPSGLSRESAIFVGFAVIKGMGGGGLSVTFPQPLSDPTAAVDAHARVEQPQRRGRSTRKCNFKESEAAKEMAKTDDNVKEFLEKAGWCAGSIVFDCLSDQ
ncbi:hypothetical protein QJQ45_021880, partial [Haematococcus lacustris]